MGGDIGKEVQRLVLNFVELVTSDGEEGIEEEAGWWGRSIVVEERRRRRERRRVLTEDVVDGGGGGIDVGLVGKTYFRPSRRGD